MTNTRFEGAQGVRIVRLDDEAAVFNPMTWETHVLNAAATLVLERLLVEPANSEEIERLLAEVLDEAERPQVAAYAASVLDQLCSLRLICER